MRDSKKEMNLGSNHRSISSPEVRMTAYKMWLSGRSKAAIARELGKAAKTIGVWIKDIQENLQIDISANPYEAVIYNLMEELDHTIRLCRSLAVMSYRQGDKKYSFGCLQNAVSAEKRRASILERAGLKFKSDLENENIELKNLCAYFLVVINNLEPLYDDLLAAGSHFPSPYEVTLEEIQSIRKTPEKLRLAHHLTDYQPPSSIGYVTLFELEKLLLSKLLNDPLTDWSSIEQGE